MSSGRPLSYPAFRRFWLASSASDLGTYVTLVAIQVLVTRWGAGRVIVASRLLCGVAFAVVALASSGLLLGIGQFLFGLSLGVENANELGYRQAVTPDRLQGRMNATMRSFNRAMIVIGAPLGGLLAVHIGYRPTIWLASGGILAVSLALACSPFRGARSEDAAVIVEP